MDRPKGGRGDAIKHLLEKAGGSPPEPPALSPTPSAPSPTPSATPSSLGSSSFSQPERPRAPGGRSALFAILKAEKTPTIPIPAVSELRVALSIPPSFAKGRAKLFQSSASSAGSESQESLSQSTSSAPAVTSPEPAAPPKNEASAPPTAQMSGLSFRERPYEPKPPVVMTGSSGQTVEVSCNYIRLEVEPDKGVFQYDVQFRPAVDSKSVRFQLLRGMQSVLGDTKSFDGTILYLPIKLPDKVTLGIGKLPTDNSDVQIQITFTKQLHAGHREVLHLYNVLFRRIMNILGLALHGQHYFDPSGAKQIPAHKLEIWPGYITAIQEYEGGVMLCCDASHRVLRTETVLQYMQDIISINPKDWKEVFQTAIVGQTVLTRYNNKVYRVDDVDFETTPRSTFKRSDGSEVSYTDYYFKQYNIKIRDLNQPLLKSRVKNKVRGQAEIQLVDLVPELSFLSGLSDEIRADMRVMKDISSCTRVSPSQRQYALKEFTRNIRENPEVSKMLKSWGLSLASTTISLPGRTLNAEDIFFGNRAVHKGSLQAEWSRMATSAPVLSAVELRNWVIVCTKRDEQKIQSFVDMVNQCSPKKGITVSKPNILTIQNDSTHNYIRTLQSSRSNDLQMVVIVFPQARQDKYSAVKKLCCIDQPVPSQVIQTKTISRPDKLRGVTQKIVLQMNCKLGGTLWSVNIPIKNTMVIGMDTFHEAAQSKHSIGAVVASLNENLTRWYSQIYRQLPGLELVDGLEICVLNCLWKYRELSGLFPEQIIIYRDGVGDGQLSYCQQHEIPQLLMAFQRIAPGYNPKVLVVIVQKRINSRIFSHDKNGMSNPPPGTVVDHTVTRRDMYDFFLVSQNVRQGTVTPTHYVVIHNSTAMTPDHVQRLSFKLTHLYYNWCGTVRVPAPCQYAHKLAYLVGESIQKEAAECLADKLFYL